MNIQEYSQKIGLQEPVRVFLMGDNHLSYADAREGERERAHAKVRNIDFFSCGQGESYLQKTYEGLLGACRDDGDLLVMVGDVIDHPSARNRELLAVAAGMHPVYAIGNHDYNNYAVEHESAALLAQRVPMFYETLGFAPYNRVTRQGGMQFVTLDNTGYQFSEAGIACVRSACRSGLPTVLVFHVPLFCEDLVEPTVAYWKIPILCGCPDGMYEKAPPVSETTARMLQLIAKEPTIVAVLAGHIHFAYAGRLPCGKMQYVCEAGYLNSASRIVFS